MCVWGGGGGGEGEGGDVVGLKETTWSPSAKDRESGTLVEGDFLQWKDTIKKEKRLNE